MVWFINTICLCSLGRLTVPKPVGCGGVVDGEDAKAPRGVTIGRPVRGGAPGSDSIAWMSNQGQALLHACRMVEGRSLTIQAGKKRSRFHQSSW